MARKTKGRLFTRGKSGTFYAEYFINGKRFSGVLRDIDGEPVTDRKQAEKILSDRLNPLRINDQAERIRQIGATVATLEERAVVAEDIANPPLTVADAWAAYLSNPDRPDSGERTLNDYGGYWKAFAAWFKDRHTGASFLRDVSPDIARDYSAALTGEGVSANTHNKRVTFLKLMFRVLADAARAPINPFAKINRKRLQTNSRRELSLEELFRVINEAEGPLALLLALGAFTGLRLGDAATLRWGEVDLARQIIRRVPNKTASRNGKPVIIGIPKVLLQKLQETPPGAREGFLFPEYAEAYQDTSKRPDLTRKIQEHFERCGIQTHKPGTGQGTSKRAVVEVGFHSLRHSYISLHAMRGTPQAVIQKQVGHSSAAMTDHYTHLDEDAARKAAAALPEAFVAPVDDPDTETRRRVQELVASADPEKLKQCLKILES